MQRKVNNQSLGWAQSQGFTIIELLVAIVILMILMLLGFALFQSTRDRANNAGVQANLSITYKTARGLAVDSKGISNDPLVLIAQFKKSEPHLDFKPYDEEGELGGPFPSTGPTDIAIGSAVDSDAVFTACAMATTGKTFCFRFDNNNSLDIQTTGNSSFFSNPVIASLSSPFSLFFPESAYAQSGGSGQLYQETTFSALSHGSNEFDARAVLPPPTDPDPIEPPGDEEPLPGYEDGPNESGKGPGETGYDAWTPEMNPDVTTICYRPDHRRGHWYTIEVHNETVDGHLAQGAHLGSCLNAPPCVDPPGQGGGTTANCDPDFIPPGLEDGGPGNSNN